MTTPVPIREERQRRGMSLAQLSRRAGMSSSNLSLIERGLTDPRWSTVVRIYEALGIRPAVGGEGGSDPWSRLRRKAERGEDVRDEAWALAANTARRASVAGG